MGKKKSILIAFILSVISFNAFAYKIVFDPKHMAKSLVTAKTAMKIEVLEVQQKLQQYKQLQTMYDNLKKQNPSQFIQQAAETNSALKNLKEYESSLRDVNAALGDQSDYLNNLHKNYVLSGSGNFSDYMNVLKKRSDSGNLKARQLIDMSQSVQKNVAETTKRRQILQKQTENSVGILQSSQTTNQYLDTIVSQNSQISAMLAEQTFVQAEAKKTKSLYDADNKKMQEDYKNKSQRAYDSLDDRWGK